MASTAPAADVPVGTASTYWLTRFVLLRGIGLIYAIAFLVAAQQLVPLVGAHGLLPAPVFLSRVSDSLGSQWNGFCELPSLFWLNSSDAALRIIPWIGFGLSCVVVLGFANAPIMTILWIFYLSIIHIGQDWYGYGWEIQLVETGFLAIFLCPLLDVRPFPRRPTPVPLLWLFRWLIFRVMLGSGLIKLRGDPCWTDFTALFYHFETQPIPNPMSRWFHFLPHDLLMFGTVLTLLIEVAVPWFLFGPRRARHLSAFLVVLLQVTIAVSGNLSFFNWLTILPALACFDDSFWRNFFPATLTQRAEAAAKTAVSNFAMTCTSWGVTVLIALLSFAPAANLLSSRQVMNTSFDRLHLVNTYGAFGSILRERDTIIFEGTDDPIPDDNAHWKEYTFAALPSDPLKSPRQIAPYQPHLDWQLWFAAMGTPVEYPWTFNLVWKLLHNDPATLGLLGSNPFPDKPPRYIRAVLYRYRFTPPNNPQHLYWFRNRIDLWLPPLSSNDPRLQELLQQAGWMTNPNG